MGRGVGVGMGMGMDMGGRKDFIRWLAIQSDAYCFQFGFE